MGKQYDWERIETEYRANRSSIREIAKAHGITEGAIRKKAKAQGWERDLSKKAKERTQDKLVRTQVRTSNARENEIVEEIATRSAAVVESHRKDINDGRNITGMLMSELKDGTQHKETLGELISQQADEEDWDNRRKQAAQRAISLPQRASVMRDLSTAMKTLQTLERTAFGVDGKETDKDPLDEVLEAVQDTSRGVDGYNDE